MAVSREGIREVFQDWQSYFSILNGKVNPELLERARMLMIPEQHGVQEGENPLIADSENLAVQFFGELVELADEPIFPEEPDAYIISRVSPEEVRRYYTPSEEVEPREPTLEEMEHRMLVLRAQLALMGSFE